MDKQHFDRLVKGVHEMKRHMAGERVRGARTTELAEPDVRAIREAAKLSQSQFANLSVSISEHFKTGNKSGRGRPDPRGRY